MSPLLQRSSMRFFMVSIFVMGVIRFVLTFAGYPNSIVKYFSMTAIIMAGTLYFAVATSTHKERLKASYLLILPYMIVEVSALGYVWASGRELIFHAPEYSFGGTPIAAHFFGHLIGGLTWEPLSVFLVMEVVWAIYTLAARLVSGRKREAGV
jgi:hypothetical protein